MPRYRVLKPGFFNSEYYSPTGKRSVLVTDKPFKKDNIPSWLEAIKEESAAQRKKRESVESKNAADDALKSESDKRDIDSVTFTQAPSRTHVETL